MNELEVSLSNVKKQTLSSIESIAELKGTSSILDDTF